MKYLGETGAYRVHNGYHIRLIFYLDTTVNRVILKTEIGFI
jgi:hypothetical protein